MNSDTPRTDAAYASSGYDYDEPYVPASFARQLERELNEVNKSLHIVRVEMGMLISERDQLKSEVVQWKQKSFELQQQLASHKANAERLAVSVRMSKSLFGMPDIILSRQGTWFIMTDTLKHHDEALAAHYALKGQP